VERELRLGLHHVLHLDVLLRSPLLARPVLLERWYVLPRVCV